MKRERKKQLGKHRSAKAQFRIREISVGELETAAELIARLKRLNGEFDPLLKTSDRAESDSLRILRDTFRDKDHLVLVALSGSKVVGVAKALLRDRVFYEPRKEGAIIELYIMPEFRRGSLGLELFDRMVSSLQKKGAQLITAEFPSQNEIARKFYAKLGFRSLTNVYARPS